MSIALKCGDLTAKPRAEKERGLCGIVISIECGHFCQCYDLKDNV